jgi:hypothetical protein
MTGEEADEAIQDARERLMAGEYGDAEECLEEEFGLEPDYFFDLFGR